MGKRLENKGETNEWWIEKRYNRWKNSLEELKKMKQECKQKEKDILDKINKTLEREADDL